MASESYRSESLKAALKDKNWDEIIRLQTSLPDLTWLSPCIEHATSHMTMNPWCFVTTQLIERVMSIQDAGMEAFFQKLCEHTTLSQINGFDILVHKRRRQVNPLQFIIQWPYHNNEFQCHSPRDVMLTIHAKQDEIAAVCLRMLPGTWWDLVAKHSAEGMLLLAIGRGRKRCAEVLLERTPWSQPLQARCALYCFLSKQRRETLKPIMKTTMPLSLTYAPQYMLGLFESNPLPNPNLVGILDSNDGKTLLHYAVEQTYLLWYEHVDYEYVISFLVRIVGVDIHLKDSDDQTPLDIFNDELVQHSLQQLTVLKGAKQAELTRQECTRYLSGAYFAEKERLAVAMALHPRLGKDAPLGALGVDTLRHIAWLPGLAIEHAQTSQL